MQFSGDLKIILRKNFQHVLRQLLVMITGIGTEVIKEIPGH